MRKKFAGLAAVSTLALAACASVDKEKLDARIPDAPSKWAASDDVGAPPAGDWVGSLGDPQLYSLIAEALTHNNTLLAAAANLKAARAIAKIERADLLPTVNASGNAGRNAIVTDPSLQAQTGGGGGAASPLAGLRAQELEDRFGIDSNGDGKIDGLDLDGNGTRDADIPNRRIYINNFALGAQLSWEIDLWGRLTDETKAAWRDARASLADYDSTRLSIAGRVAQAWFGLIEARQQRELGERDTAARDSNLRVTERRYERGVASSLDVRLSRSALGSSRANLAFRQQAEKEAARRLEVLLGRYPAAELAAASSLPALTALAGAGAPGEILARRPDLRAAEARMESAGLRARAARKQMLPSLRLSSSISTSGPDLADVIDPERLAGNIASGLFQPLFQGGRLLYNSKRAKAAAEASLLNYAQTALNAYEEAENAISAETYLALREDALKLAYEEAAAAEELTERRYASGAATIFDLLNAQTRRISSESAFLSARQQRVSNRVLLYLAIGGDFLVEPEGASATEAPSPG
jgi:NodT family efflux transporter outer membrane factor (OMF) lipoprotein